VNLEENYVFVAYGKTNAAHRKIPLSKKFSDLLRLRLISA
jgi:hypothetical protein